MLLATQKWTIQNDCKTVKLAYISPVRYTLRNTRAIKTKNIKVFRNHIGSTVGLCFWDSSMDVVVKIKRLILWWEVKFLA